MANEDTSNNNDRLARTIARAINDGCLSREESDRIKRMIYTNGQATPKDLKLFRELQHKVWQGEVILWDGGIGDQGTF